MPEQPRATPLGLTDQQFTTLTNAAAQLHPADRDPFLHAVAARFRGCSDLGDGEFARGLRELLRSGAFKRATWPAAPPSGAPPEQAGGRRPDRVSVGLSGAGGCLQQFPGPAVSAPGES
jgi:hypothetical protein